MKFKHVLSIGYNCGAAYQIKLHTRNAEAHFFDWLFTSTAAANNLIENDFSGFMEREHLKIVRDGIETMDMKTGIRFNHSFKHGGNGKVVPELVDERFEAEKAKFLYMAEKFRGILSDPAPVAFIRYNPLIGQYDSQQDVERLVEALAAKRSAPFRVFWIKKTEQDVLRRDLSDTLTEICLPEDPSRSKSLNGRSFILTDDIAWGEFFSTIEFETPRKLLNVAEGVFDRRGH